MSQVAVVVDIVGEGLAYVVSPGGERRVLKEGDPIQKGETILTSTGVRVELMLTDTNPLTVEPNQAVRIDDNVVRSEGTPTAQDSAIPNPASTAEVVIQSLERGTNTNGQGTAAGTGGGDPTVQSLIQTLQSGGDLSQTLESTAAGTSGGGGGGATDGGGGFVDLSRIVEPTTPLSFSVGSIAPTRVEYLVSSPTALATPPTVFSVANASITEGGLLTFTVTRSGDAQAAQSVSFATSLASGDSASSGDFTSTSGTLTFNQGETEKTFTVQTSADTLLEANETLTVSLSSPSSGASISATAGAATGTITNDDNAPVAGNDSFTVDEDSTNTTLNLLGNDNDPDGDTLSIFSIAGTALTPGTAQTITVTNGTVNVSATGVVTFTPAANYNGPVSFDYVVTDGTNTDTSTLTLSVTAVDDTFTDGDENVSTNEDTTKSGNVLDNVNPVTTGDGTVVVTKFTVAGVGTGNPLVLTEFAAGEIATIPGKGTITIAYNGAYTFTPADNYNGALPVITYTLSDGVGDTDTSTLAINVSAANDNFTDADETLTVAEDSSATTGSLLSGTSSVDGPVSIASFSVAGEPAGSTFTLGTAYTVTGKGSITVNADGSYSFTPATNYNGTFPTVTYTVTDGSGTNDTSTLAINVSAVNDPPVTVPDAPSTTTLEGSTKSFSSTVLANDTDPDLQAPLVVFQVAPTPTGTPVALNGVPNSVTTLMGGTVVMNPNGTFTYTAPAVEHASSNTPVVDSFVYKAWDGVNASNWTTVSLNIGDTAPVAKADFDTVAPMNTVTGNVITGLGVAPGGQDILGADATTVTKVAYKGTDYTDHDNNGLITVNADEGVLTMNTATGAYTFEATVQPLTTGVANSATALQNWTNLGIRVLGFESGNADSPFNTPADAASGLKLALVDGTADKRQIRYSNPSGSSNDGIGVDSSTSTSGTTEQIENGERLVIDLGQVNTSASLTLTSMSSGESVLWYAYDSSGNLAGNGTISGTTNPTVATITPTSSFQYLVLTSNAAAYLLNGITTTVPDPVFTYTLTDEDGSASSSTLTLKVTKTAQDDTAKVDEAGLSSGTQTGVAAITASGNLLSNDQGLTPTTSIISVAGVAPGVNGVITVSNSTGTLTVYTQAVNGRAAGDYSYTLIGATSDGVNDTPSFTYQLKDSSNGQTASAKLTVEIQDDTPVATSGTVEVIESPAVRHNVVLMLDISDSMNVNDAGGAVRLVQADGTATISTRLDLAKIGLIALVEEYIDQTAQVDFKLGLFANGSTMLNGGNVYADKSSLIAAINGITGNELTSGTQFGAGLQAMQAAFGTVDMSKINSSYFISDGAPTDSPSAQITAYTNFAAANNIRSYAVGIGTGIASTTALNGIHNVDADGSGLKDLALLVTDVNRLDEVLAATVPRAFRGNIADASGASNVNFGADGGYISQIVLPIDEDGEGGNPAIPVMFSFDPTMNQITASENLAILGSLPPGSQLNIGPAKGLTIGTLVLDFSTGEYTFFANPESNAGNELAIEFTVTDGDGDSASATQTIKIVDGAPIARDDVDTLRPGEALFEGNVISGVGTDGGVATLVSDLGTTGGGDAIIDDAKVALVTFRGQTFDLRTDSTGSGTDSSGVAYNFSISGGRLTWTNVGEPSNKLVFDNDGYYQYTPPSAQIGTQTGVLWSNNFTSATGASANGVTLSGYSSTGNLQQAANQTLTYSSTGVGVTGGEGGKGTNNVVDDLETLVIDFSRTTHPQGVRDVTFTVNAANSNLGTNQSVGSYTSGVVVSVTYSAYDIGGRLIGQFVSTTEGTVTLPSSYTNIGRIEIEASSPAQARIQDMGFRSITGSSVTTEVTPESINYTLVDSDGDSSQATLLLSNITNQLAGTSGNNTLTGTSASDLISGLGGDDLVSGLGGSDVLYGGAGNDQLLGGAGGDRLYGEAGADTLTGDAGSDRLYGGDGADSLDGGADADTLSGGTGNDTVRGGTGADTIQGGSGNDVLFGNAATGIDTDASDVFRWELDDIGTKGAPAHDVIKDFNPAQASSGGDVLDLRDLLVSEHAAGSSGGNLDDYLHFELSGSNTIVHVSATGEFANGFDPSKEVQKITLEGVDVFNAGSLYTDQQVIQDLLTKGKLIVDN